MPLSMRAACPIFAALWPIALTCCLTVAAHADDCSAAKAGMLAAARTPHTATFTKTKDGKPVTSRMIQTKDARYFEVNGKWRTMRFSADDVREMEDSLNKSALTCARVGRDSLDGKAVTVYTIHAKNEDDESDAKLWLGADGLPLKVDNTTEDGKYSSTYDFAHADAPAESTPIGKR